MAERGDKAATRGIQSIEVGNRLLSALMKATRPIMLRDLAAEADLTPAQAHAYLASFRRVDLVEQDAASGRYILGPMALRLAMARLNGTEPLAAASRAASGLSRSLGTLISLVVWGPTAPIAIQVHQGAQNLGVNIRAGTTFSVTGSADGRVFGAFSRAADVWERIEAEFVGLNNAGIGTPATPQQFERELEIIRATGYAVMAQSPVPLVTSISAPVINTAGMLELTLTIVGRTVDLDPSPTSAYVRALLNTTHRLGREAPATR